MAFLESPRFPVGISFGAVGGPGYSTDVVVMGGGAEQRNQNWSAARCAYDVARACKTLAIRDELIAFFRIAKGRANGFRFKDWTDYEVATTEGVLSSLGSGQYQLQKRYTHAGGTEDRDIQKPVSGTAAVYTSGDVLLVAGVDYTIDTTTGIITVQGSPTPAPAKWSGEFDVPVRFDIDRLGLIAEDIEFFRSQSIPLVEIRL